MKTKNWLVLLLALLLAVSLCGCKKNQAGESGNMTAEEDLLTDFEGIHLGDGLTLEGLAAATGLYPEDGSDEQVSEVLAATFTNYGEKTVQYARVIVTLNGEDYLFELSTVPPGTGICAFELERKTAPEKAESVEARAEHLMLFEEEPSRETDALKVTFGEGTVAVENISGGHIPQDVSVYYKRSAGGLYMGGITYRVRVGPLEAGELISGFSSHADSDSVLMFVTYGG